MDGVDWRRHTWCSHQSCGINLADTPMILPCSLHLVMLMCPPCGLHSWFRSWVILGLLHGPHQITFLCTNKLLRYAKYNGILSFGLCSLWSHPFKVIWMMSHKFYRPVWISFNCTVCCGFRINYTVYVQLHIFSCAYVHGKVCLVPWEVSQRHVLQLHNTFRVSCSLEVLMARGQYAVEICWVLLCKFFHRAKPLRDILFLSVRNCFLQWVSDKGKAFFSLPHLYTTSVNEAWR